MKNGLKPGMLLLAAAFALAACLPFAGMATSRRDFYFFDVELTSNREAHTQIFFDVGRGPNESDSSIQPLHARSKPVKYRFMMPPGLLRGLRFDPLDCEGEMTLAHARIVDNHGRIVRAFAPEDLRAVQQIATHEITGEVVRIVAEKKARDPAIQITLGEPILLDLGWRQYLSVLWPVFTIAFLALLLPMMALDSARMRRRLDSIVARARARPVTTLAVVAAAAVLIQCHPVIFCGKSFVSPDNAAYLLYDTFPTLPGYQSKELEDAHGSDVGAMLYYHLYCPVDEREALFAHGELPLWNRYDLCGLPLLGQGQSMFGDVLNILPLVTRSSAWAWDVKFVLAHWLYAFAVALAVHRLTRHLLSAVVLAFAAVFIGFFAFRINHPAQFSLCYSPWILVAWLWVRDARSRKTLGWSLGLWIFANWEVMTSGTVKEAYMLILGINFAGLLVLLLTDLSWRERVRKLTGVALAGVIFVLLSAPLWITFADTLAASHTNYDVPNALQIEPSLFIGFFEDMFYRQLQPNENQTNPSVNFVVLLGVLWAITQAAHTFRQRGFVALGLAALLPLGIVFGVVPAALIMKIPFFANIHHTDNTFSCVLIVLLTVLSGYGLQALRFGLGRPGWGIGCALFSLSLLAMGGVYFGSAQAVAKSDFFWGYAAALVLALVTGLGGLVYWAKTGRTGVLLATIGAAFVLLLWRHAEYVRTPFDPYVFNPKVRADLHARSPAIEQVRKLITEPSRPSGLGKTLYVGYHQMLGWEGIYGADAVRNRYFDELATAGGVKRIHTWDASPWNEADFSAQLPLLDLFNVRYHLGTHHDSASTIPGLRALGSYDLDLYESETAWPRAFFTDRVVTYSSVDDFVRQVRRERRPFAAVDAAEAADIKVPISPKASGGNESIMRPAHDYALTSNQTAFTVDAPGPGVVVLTEAYYPLDFQVQLDDAPVAYFRANHAFKAIAIPTAGHHRVTFTYRPHRLSLALALFATGAVLLLLAVAGCVLAEKKQRVAALPAAA